MKRRLSLTEGERVKEEQLKKAKQEQEEEMEDKKTYLVRVATTLCSTSHRSHRSLGSSI